MSAAQGGLEGKVAALRALEEIIERLRGPQGCPWDRRQTLESMAPNILEEACEAIDAIREGGGRPRPEVCEELGDLLMNILLTARIAEEEGAFGLLEVAEGISAKLVRRHPHVFGSESASTVDQVLHRWSAIKAEEEKEKGGGEAAADRPSRLGRIPRSLPALAAATKVGQKAAEVGFDWPDAAGALRKVEEETREVAEALACASAGPAAATGEPAASTESGGGSRKEPDREVAREVGDLLLAAVNLARKSGVDPESALRAATDRFVRRFQAMEARADLAAATMERMEELWQEAKRDED